MGKIIYVTGGARSGKSSFAESLLEEFDNVLYIATAIPFDDEMKDRVKIHRERRKSSWQTLEAYRDFSEGINERGRGMDALLFDCVTIMVTNLMLSDFDIDWDSADQQSVHRIEEHVMNHTDELITALKDFNGISVIVSNELGMGLVPPTPLGRHYRDIAGRANQRIAQASDEAYLVVSGIPVRIKG